VRDLRLAFGGMKQRGVDREGGDEEKGVNLLGKPTLLTFCGRKLARLS